MRKTTLSLRALGISAPLVILLGLAAARTLAQDAPKESKPEAAIWITEIDRDGDGGQVHLLLNVGRDAGLQRGDTVSVERDGKKVARATIIASYPDVAMADVDSVEKDATVTRGDWVRLAAKGKRVPAAADKPITVGSITKGADGEPELQLTGGELGYKAGVEAMVMRDGKPVGRIKLKTWDTSWKASLVEGDAHVGDRVELVPDEHGSGLLTPDELKRLRQQADPPKGIDFAQTGFLGVVGEIEHPVRIMAPCHIGVLVRRVAEGSPAERAKIRVGDRVIAIDDRIVRTPGEIYHGIQRRSGDQVRVTIARDDVLQVVTADFSKR